MSTLILQMNKACDKVNSRDNRDTISYLIDSGRVNANETVYVEKAVGEDEYDRIVRGSISSLLACEKFNRHVHAFFAKFDIVA